MIARQFVVRPSRRLALIGLVAPLLCAASVVAQVPVPPLIVDSSGFESPKFDVTFGPGGTGTGVGQLEGQTPFTFNGTWQRTQSGSTSTANVQTAVKLTGNQAVKVTRPTNSTDERWGVPVSGYPSIGGRYICISWDMRVEETVVPRNPQTNFGPFFGVEAYDDDGNAVGLMGSFGVDASNGEVLIQQANTGFFAAPGPVVAFGSWHNYMIELDFLTHTYKYILDNVALGMEGYVDQIISGGLNEFSEADISTLAAAGNAGSLALGGSAYFDNFKVLDGPCPVPEPSALVLGMLGLCGVAARRRARRS